LESDFTWFWIGTEIWARKKEKDLTQKSLRKATEDTEKPELGAIGDDQGEVAERWSRVKAAARPPHSKVG
jgi:hypothetical protein